MVTLYTYANRCSFYYSHMSQCHEKWDEADVAIQQGQCEGLCYILLGLIAFITWRFTHRTCRLRGEPGPRVRPVDPPQLHQGPGPLHEGGAQDPEQRAPAASAATALKKVEKKSVSRNVDSLKKVDYASKEYSKLGFSKLSFFGAPNHVSLNELDARPPCKIYPRASLVQGMNFSRLAPCDTYIRQGVNSVLLVVCYDFP